MAHAGERTWLMQPDKHSDRDLAAQETWLAVQLQGLPTPEPEPSYLTWGNVLVIVLGFALAWGLAALQLGG
jgi:hypothetical protein